MKNVIWIVLFSLLSPAAARAEGTPKSEICLAEVVVTASYNPLETHQTGRAITATDPEDQPADDNALSLIEEVEGVRVKRTGADGSLSTIRLRGARSIDTKIELDGFELRDPSDPQGSANPLLGDLPAFGIARAEVLRGPASAIHGSAAMGGVVGFQSGARDGLELFGEYGAGDTLREGASYGSKDHDVAAERTDSSGFDAHDDYERTGVIGRSRFRLGEHLAEVSYLVSRADADLDSAPFLIGGMAQSQQDDENDTTERDLQHGGVRLEGPVTDSIGYRVKAAATHSDRRFTFLPNEDGSGFFSDGTFEGLDVKLSEELRFEHSDALSTVIGHEHSREFLTQKVYVDPLPNLDDHADQYANDFFVEETARLGATTLVGSVRENTHESAKGRLTWDASAAHVLPCFTVLRAHAGTAYREPSLFELDGAFLTSFGNFEVGNPLLSPERSSGWDLGMEHPFGDLRLGDLPIGNITIGSTYFRWDRQNAIDLIGGAYRNTAVGVRAGGLEAFAEWAEGPWTARLSQTHIEAEGLGDVPGNTWAGVVAWKQGKWAVAASGTRVGARQAILFDMDTFSLGRVSEEAYFEAAAAVSYDLTPNVTVYLRGENIFDENHTDGGYLVPGARAYGGARIRF